MFCCVCYGLPDSSLAMCRTPLLGSFLILPSEQGEKAEEPCPEAECVCGRSCLGAISKAGCHSHCFDPHHAFWHFVRSRLPGNSSCFLRARTGSRNVVFLFSLCSVLPAYLNKFFCVHVFIIQCKDSLLTGSHKQFKQNSLFNK